MMKALQLTLCLLLIMPFTGCFNTTDQLKWLVTFKNDDKKPYGTYLAYQSLKNYFPGAAIGDLSEQYHFSSIDGKMIFSNNGANLMILCGKSFNLTEGEWDKVRLFVRSGNEVIIFSEALDTKIEDELTCYTKHNNEDFGPFTPLNLNKANLQLTQNKLINYTYKGKNLDGYFYYDQEKKDIDNHPKDDTANADQTSADSAVTADSTNAETDTTATADAESEDDGSSVSSYYILADTLGYANGKANFVRFTMGNGHIYLHASPFVLTNYFLLQNGNIDYLTGIWQTLPANINHIYWSTFLTRSGQETNSSFLFRYASTRAAIWLALLLTAVYVIFQMKRMQRIIPIIPPLKNDSVSFVETVGRLYYNKGDNGNLADKMIQQYLEWVRMTYYLNTNLLNNEFITQLTRKSGEKEATVAGLVGMIHEVRLRSVIIDEAYLYQLYRATQHFYKKQQN